MLAVKLHGHPKPPLGRGAFLIPIIDWKSGRVQVRTWLRWYKRAHYLTLVRIPAGHPVRFCFTYGPSNFIKQVVWPTEYRPLSEWPREYPQAIATWWDAWRLPRPDVELGGLMVYEPRLFLGRKLPESCVKWTKDVRLLYQSRGRSRGGQDPDGGSPRRRGVPDPVRRSGRHQA
jgi:hypothetical protein